MRWRAWLVLGALLLPVAPALGAPRHLGIPRPDVVAEWRLRMERIDEDIRAGRSASARRSADLLLDQMVGSVEGGEGAGALLAMAALLRGLAKAGDGDARGGAWDFATAVALEPAFRDSGLGVYGVAG